ARADATTSVSRLRPRACWQNGSLRNGVRPLRSDAELLHGRAHSGHVELAFVGERAKRSYDDVPTAHLEMAAKLGARVAATKAVGTQHDVAPRHPLTDLVRHDLHVIAGGDKRASTIADALTHVRLL